MHAKRAKSEWGMGARAGLTALMLSVGGVAPPALAQRPAAGDDKSHSAWVKLCEKASKKKLNVCLTQHERLDGSTGIVLVSAAVRQMEGRHKKALLVMVPPGMALPLGLQVKVDEKELVKLQFTLCHAAGCTAEGEATKAVIDRLKTGKQAVVTAINLAGKPIDFLIPLSGFDKAHAGAPVDNEKHKEARKRLIDAIREREHQNRNLHYKKIAREGA